MPAARILFQNFLEGGIEFLGERRVTPLNEAVGNYNSSGATGSLAAVSVTPLNESSY